MAKVVPLVRRANRTAVGSRAGQVDPSGDWDSPETHDPDISFSSVSWSEITIKQTAGKLAGPPDLAERVRDMGFRELPVIHGHAIAAGRLPPHHRDPFGRTLVAQAVTEGLTLATRDVPIALYDLDVLKV